MPHDVERSAIIAARAKRKEASRYPERRWSQNRQIRSRPLASPQAHHLVFCFLPLGCPPSSFSTGTGLRVAQHAAMGSAALNEGLLEEHLRVR